GDLIERNGLWQSVLSVSDAVLCDSATNLQGSALAYLSPHWASAVSFKPRPISVEPAPVRNGEQDVDTVLHLVFARLAKAHCFEGLCNPPGGDWSGLSLQNSD